MELKQKNKLTNVSECSFVGSVLRDTENSVFTYLLVVIGQLLHLPSFGRCI